MDFTNMESSDLIERRKAIGEEVNVDGADLDALEKELDAINAELESRKAAEEKRQTIRDAVAAGAGTVIAEPEKEERKEMTNKEVRNTPEYIEAFEKYVRSGDDKECRALLTENATNGTVPVPEFVYDIVKTAWERDGITSRVRKAYLRGNLKVGFEISADGAVIHTEGDVAIDPENLVLGVVNLVPQSIKKVVQISDEVYDLRGEAFLRYIYDELTYRIAKKAADTLIDKILACGTVSTTTCPGVPAMSVRTASLGTVADAISHLSDEAANPVIMMNKLTWGAFKGLQAAGNYGYDPFEGLPVVFNDHITAYSAATTGVAYLIVGDLDHGALMNFPNGNDIEFKFDNLTLKKQDMIEVLGRQFVGMGVVAPNAFVKVTK
jgi:HK97 family phage major capsid protein